jgi:hypothetical protein
MCEHHGYYTANIIQHLSACWSSPRHYQYFCSGAGGLSRLNTRALRSEELANEPVTDKRCMRGTTKS